MKTDYVGFDVEGKSLRTTFDRAHLRLGSVVYVEFSPKQEPIAVSSQERLGTVPYSVKWIAPSEWYVQLTQGLKLSPDFSQRIQDEIGAYISRNDIDVTLARFASRVRMEHLYKTKELAKNPRTLIYTVLERLDVCSRIKQPEVEKALFAYHEPLVSYLYLTCFDRLGQPADWETFGEWLVSSSKMPERETALTKISPGLDQVGVAVALHSHYSTLYGVRSSFFRFLREIIPPEVRRELLDSMEIRRLKNPPDLADLAPATDEEKEKYLFKRRNDYTHQADFKPSAGPPLGRSYSNHVQEFHAEDWTDTSTNNWPEILNKVVRIGLARYLLLAN